MPLCYNFYFIVYSLAQLLKCPAPPFESSHPTIQLPKSSVLPESSELPGPPHCATNMAYKQRLAPRQQHGLSGTSRLVSQHLSESASLIPVFWFASPLLPGAMSSASTFCFPHKQWFNFFFYSLHFQNFYGFSFLEPPLVIPYLIFFSMNAIASFISLSFLKILTQKLT